MCTVQPLLFAVDMLLLVLLDHRFHFPFGIVWSWVSWELAPPSLRHGFLLKQSGLFTPGNKRTLVMKWELSWKSQTSPLVRNSECWPKYLDCRTVWHGSTSGAYLLLLCVKRSWYIAWECLGRDWKMLGRMVSVITFSAWCNHSLMTIHKNK